MVGREDNFLHQQLPGLQAIGPLQALHRVSIPPCYRNSGLGGRRVHRNVTRSPRQAVCGLMLLHPGVIAMPKFRSLVPMLQTLDMERTIAWYEFVLGFQRVGEQADGWCCLSRDGISIMFMTNAHLGPPHATATQYISVDNADALWEQVKENCQAEWGPEDMPYGLLGVRHQGP